MSDCKTPEAVYHISIYPNSVYCKVDLPFKLELNEKEIKVLEDQVHDCFEDVLSEYLKK